MDNNNERTLSDRREYERALSLDEVLATQPELGPNIPDGGFGWVVFIATLFFRVLVPCLIVNYGVFLAFSKLVNGTADDKNIMLWDDRLLYVALFFVISRSLFDSFARQLSSATTSPRLISVVGTCLTCAGLLFMWMGMTGRNDYWLYAPAGILSGVGTTIVLVQCETLVGQYFRLKLPILNQVSQCAATIGFLIAPIVLGHHILNTSLTQVLLWYQAIILQGLIISLFFRKPLYLKSKNRNKPYHFISPNPDDEEDILSKNSRELQIKRQSSTENHVKKITINLPQAGSSNSNEQEEVVEVHENQREKPHKASNKWAVNFDEEDEDVKYLKLNKWEIFDDEEEVNKDQTTKKQNWERFEDEPPSPRIVNNLSFAEEANTGQINQVPSPLFSDLPVNNNNTYAYDEEILPENANSNVFVPNNVTTQSFGKHLELLKQLTFYKSLLMMIANTYSSFIFFTLYPSYLYIQSDSVNIRHMTEIIGVLSLVNLIFLSVIYWINIDKKKRAVCFGVFYWVGSVGYFMIADFTHEYLLLIGGIQIILSIGSLEHIAQPLRKLPLKGTSSENFLLSVLSSFALFLFLFLDISFKTCFRLMAVLHFFTGSLWLVNFAYKKLRQW